MQRELTAQRNPCQRETVLKVQNQEEVANQSPRGSLKTLDSLGVQFCAALRAGAETRDSFEQDFGKGAFPKVSERGGYLVPYQGTSYAIAKG